jgi:hypothetical protein
VILDVKKKRGLPTGLINDDAAHASPSPSSSTSTSTSTAPAGASRSSIRRRPDHRRARMGVLEGS